MCVIFCTKFFGVRKVSLCYIARSILWHLKLRELGFKAYIVVAYGASFFYRIFYTWWYTIHAMKISQRIHNNIFDMMLYEKSFPSDYVRKNIQIILMKQRISDIRLLIWWPLLCNPTEKLDKKLHQFFVWHKYAIRPHLVILY